MPTVVQSCTRSVRRSSYKSYTVSMRQLILASTSPSRQELLKKRGLDFSVVGSGFEEWLDDSLSAMEMTKVLGLGKVRSVAREHPEAIVIGGDTIVTVVGKQLGKAESYEEALEMWRLCCSAPNVLTSSLAVVCEALDFEYVVADEATITFLPFDEEKIRAYLDTGDYVGKAGAWSIQEARYLMASVEGDPDTIVGLPYRLLAPVLEELRSRE